MVLPLRKHVFEDRLNFKVDFEIVFTFMAIKILSDSGCHDLSDVSGERAFSAKKASEKNMSRPLS